MDTDLHFLLANFFTHKDFLPPASQIPGTLFTPLHFAFSAALLMMIAVLSSGLASNPHKIKPVFTRIWIVAVIFEIVIIAYDNLAGASTTFDFQTSLSLYPCSLFLYCLPFIIWGRGIWKDMAYGYMCTVGALGGFVNFIYPGIRLASYSCISFAGFHTFFFHGAMVFVYLTIMNAGLFTYKIENFKSLFVPCIPVLMLSIPANVMNYMFDCDYMFFRGQLPLFAFIFGGLNEIVITLIVYCVYLILPTLFFILFGEILPRMLGLGRLKDKITSRLVV